MCKLCDFVYSDRKPGRVLKEHICGCMSECGTEYLCHPAIREILEALSDLVSAGFWVGTTGAETTEFIRKWSPVYENAKKVLDQTGEYDSHEGKSQESRE